MKILFVADIHIKLRQKNIPEKWARGRLDLLWDTIIKEYKENEADLVILGGDIFDDVPTMKELGIYFDMLLKFEAQKIRLLIYPGNHEAEKKNSSFLEYLKDITENVSENFELISEFENCGHFSVLPYTDLHSKKWHDKSGRLLFTHVRGEIPPHVKPEIDLNLFDRWDLVISGDLHSHKNTQRNIVYPGSPFVTSFHRNRVSGSNGAILVDSEALQWKFLEFDLPQLIRKTVRSEEEMVPTFPDHTVYELVGDSADLAKVKNSELLDKKISRRVVDSTLDFEETASIKDELVLYLKEVEKISDVGPYLTAMETYIPDVNS